MFKHDESTDLSIKLGDYVRSYDFDSSDRCYVEGYVTGFKEIEGCTRYEIRIARQIFDGELIDAARTGTHVYPPVNGTRKLFGGACTGVRRIYR